MYPRRLACFLDDVAGNLEVFDWPAGLRDSNGMDDTEKVFAKSSGASAQSSTLPPGNTWRTPPDGFEGIPIFVVDSVVPVVDTWGSTLDIVQR